MQPTKLTLEGFQSYLEPQTIDLTTVTAASVTGPVGAGKSTILDGITYALYGQLRTPTKDGAIHTAAKTLKVELEFLLDGSTWKVTRTVGIKTAAKAYLYRLTDGDEWENRGDGDGRVAATDQAISDLLRLTWPAFRASVLVEQGKSGTFANAAPADRHAILADILDLGQYADLAEKLSKDRLTRAKDRDALSAAITGYQQDLDGADRIHTDLAQAKKDHATAKKAVKKAQTALEQAQQAHQKAKDDWHEAKAARADYDHRVKAARMAIVNADYKVNSLENAREQAQHEVENLERSAAHQERLTRAEEERLAEVIATAEKTLAQVPQLEAERDAARAALTRAQEKVEQATHDLEQAQANRQDHQTQLTRVETDLAATRTAWNEENERLKALTEAHQHHQSGQCYACGQPVDDTLMARMAADLKQRLADLAETGKQSAHQAEQLRANVQQATASCTEATERITTARTEAEQAQATLTRLDETINGLDQTRDEKKRAENQKEALNRPDSAQATTAAETQAALTEARERVSAETEKAQAAATELHQAKNEMATLESSADQFPDLETLETTGREQGQRVTEATEALTTAQKTATEADSHQAVLEADAARMETITNKLDTARKEAKDIDKELSGLDASIQACKPSGIPRMIINDAINSLNEALDEHLSELSDGKLSAALSTTRATKKGTEKSELTLMVTGTDGTERTRPYESFSGGQRFLVDLALHLALAKVLKDRRGAVLDMMCIDEGASALEGEEKDSVLRVVQQVAANMVNLLLMVTHDPDVVSALPNQVHVQMISATSVAEVS